MPRSSKDIAGVQSIEVGAALLRVLAHGDGPMKLTDLATIAGMSTSRAHKYLTSFIRCGLVRQNQTSGRYGLGSLAAEIGFAALRTMDVADAAQDTLDDLRDRLQTVTSLTVWANRGPTIIRRSVHEQSVSLVVQLGAVLSMLTSSNGRIFSAYLAKDVSGPLIAEELNSRNGMASRAGLRSIRDVNAMLADVRAKGFATARGTMHQGIAAISAPVFDHAGKIVAALTLVGMEGVLDLSPDGRPVRTLLKAATDLSARIGAPSSKETTILTETTPKRRAKILTKAS
jgi:DNA-binding IclR family transcriptional regulator